MVDRLPGPPGPKPQKSLRIEQLASSRCQITRHLPRRRTNSEFHGRGSRTRHPSKEDGGARRDRTDDLMLAKHALSQLSYGPGRRQHQKVRTAPDEVVGLGGLEPPTSRLSSARSTQLSYKPVSHSPAKTPEGPGPVAGLVHEERETKTAASRKCSLTVSYI